MVGNNGSVIVRGMKDESRNPYNRISSPEGEFSPI
jgi:hypothetical protein